MALPEPSSVRTVLLDAGGVLVRPDFERVAEALRSRGVEAEASALRKAEALSKRELDQEGTIQRSTDEERGWAYFNLLLRHAGIERSPATDAALLELKGHHDRENLWDEVPEGVPGALEAMKEAGLRLAVVSNANGTVVRLLERLGFSAYFDLVVDSADVGVEKPDPRIFRIALEGTGAKLEETLFVGDIYHVDVVGGRAAGLRVILVDEAGLYPEVDCPRVGSLAELARHLVGGIRRGADFLLDSHSAR